MVQVTATEDSQLLQAAQWHEHDGQGWAVAGAYQKDQAAFELVMYNCTLIECTLE